MPAFSATENTARPARSPVLVIVLLALLLGLLPLTTDLYLPALPMMAEQLQASPQQTQGTFFAMLLAFGYSQIFWGPVSDCWGRRPVLLTGLLLYVLAALGSTMADHMHALIVWRAMQGVAIGAGVMAARAIVRDLYQPVEGTHIMSKAPSGLGLIAFSSPIIGSWLAVQWGWRATMTALAIAGLLVFALIALRFEESLHRRNPDALRPAVLWHNWRHILSHPTFIAYTATTSSSYAGLSVLLATASFTFMQVLGWSATQVGWLLAVNALFYIVGTFVCRALLPRLGVRHTVAIAGVLAVLCATALLACALQHVRSGLAYAAACMVFSIAHGIQQACGQSGAVSPFPTMAGTASALNGFIVMLVAFMTGQVLGASLNGTVYPLVLGMGLWCVAAALASWTLVRKYGTPTSP